MLLWLDKLNPRVRCAFGNVFNCQLIEPMSAAFVRTNIVPSFPPFLDEAGNSILVSRRILIGNVKTQCYDLTSFRKCVIIRKYLEEKNMLGIKGFQTIVKGLRTEEAA